MKTVEHKFKTNDDVTNCFTIEETKGSESLHQYYLKHYKIAKKIEGCTKERGTVYGVSKKCYEVIRAFNTKPDVFYDEDNNIMIKVTHPLGTTFDFPLSFLNSHKLKVDKCF